MSFPKDRACAVSILVTSERRAYATTPDGVWTTRNLPDVVTSVARARLLLDQLRLSCPQLEPRIEWFRIVALQGEHYRRGDVVRPVNPRSSLPSTATVVRAHRSGLRRGWLTLSVGDERVESPAALWELA